MSFSTCPIATVNAPVDQVWRLLAGRSGSVLRRVRAPAKVRSGSLVVNSPPRAQRWVPATASRSTPIIGLARKTEAPGMTRRFGGCDGVTAFQGLVTSECQT